MQCIYEIKNIINGKSYIGKTVNFNKRKRTHIKLLLEQKHHNKYLQNSVNKHGIEKFEFKVLEECSKKNLNKLEKKYIKKYKTYLREHGYNLTKGGDGSTGVIYSEEQKNNASLSRGAKNKIAIHKNGEVIRFHNTTSFCKKYKIDNASILKVLNKMKNKKISKNFTFFYEEEFERLFEEFKIKLKEIDENKHYELFQESLSDVILLNSDSKMYETNNIYKFTNQTDVSVTRTYKLFRILHNDRFSTNGWTCLYKKDYENMNIYQKFYLFYKFGLIKR